MHHTWRKFWERRHNRRRHWWTPRPESQRKGSVNAAKKWKLHIPSRRWISQNLGVNSVWEHPLESWIVRNETKNKKFFKEKSDKWHTPTPHQDDSTQDDKEAKVTSGFLQENSFYRHHVEPRVKLYEKREESSLIPLKYIDVTRTTHTSLDVLLEKKSWRFFEREWRKRIIWCIDKPHKIRLIEQMITWWIHMVQWETYEETNNLSNGQICGSKCPIQ